MNGEMFAAWIGAHAALYIVVIGRRVLLRVMGA